MKDHEAADMADISSGMATPWYGFRGSQIAHGMMAVRAVIRVNAPNFLWVGVCSRAADCISSDRASVEKKATETM